ncbi:VOC family protein [Pseudonocardia sp. MH-G8]|uniref:VOC family protein n=1 Tax=Pseudonocardia sp. MH-G8 TaxID=1854588 RepID=UPI000BA00544|nr:VOC family protein [Pseudonocardia sp. MH-G8]OZM77029.1 glyoxalase [Pseudonocardia sp. MH-G8]
MTSGMTTIIYPVTDLAKAKAVYRELLGVQPTMDEVYYVGFSVAGQDIGLDPHGHRSGPVSYWQVEDIRAGVTALVEAGAVAHQDVKDVGGGKLTAAVKDPDGNIIGLIQSA